MRQGPGSAKLAEVWPRPTRGQSTVYMSHHINPRSVNTYLSGISQQLEATFPSVKEAHNSTLVRRTLQGCMRMRGVATVHKRALTLDDFRIVINQYNNSLLHDDLLFIAMLITGFFGLLRLGEMTFPDDTSLHNWRKVSWHNTVKLSENHFKFLLPGHKADRFFEGNKIIIPADRFGLRPLQMFSKYLNSGDNLHPVASPLWLTASGSVPSRSFFVSHLWLFFTNDVAGQSMRAGGATALAEHGVPPHIIQASSHWASEAFLIYIRKHPTLLQGFLHSVSTTASLPPVSPNPS
jgi:hypothetical protein